MKKLTAVEQLMKDLHKNGFLGFYCDISLEDQKRNLAFQLIDKAKELEKEQIKNAFNNGYLNHKTNSEQYYNETFKQKES